MAAEEEVLCVTEALSSVGTETDSVSETLWLTEVELSTAMASPSAPPRLKCVKRYQPVSYTHLDVYKRQALGSDSAHSLGLSVRPVRFLLLVLAAALSGASVSFSGLLSFVGLIVPCLLYTSRCV